ncbi:MAG TPA: gliding motility lipoprotein GldD [Anseongella sp.]|nr:gliding motility lipoprotein GldD [Anseongella sp.]
MDLRSIKFGVYVLSLVLALPACRQPGHTPKPRGYFRIELPEKAYQPYGGACPFSFSIPVYADVVPDKSAEAHPCWMDLDFPQFNAKLHLSYWPVRSENMLHELMEDSRELAYKHTVKATAISEEMIVRPEKDIYGLLYRIEGNTASSLQFFLTDSSRHYLRGALYFHEEPRLDSIRPVLDFIRQDIDSLVTSFQWK